MVVLNTKQILNDAVSKCLDNNSNGQWEIHHGTYETITWKEGVVPPSKEVFDNEVIRLVEEYNANEYARNRLEAYNALNQFELISDDSINGTTTHKDAILAIKAEFPKP